MIATGGKLLVQGLGFRISVLLMYNNKKQCRFKTARLCRVQWMAPGAPNPSPESAFFATFSVYCHYREHCHLCRVGGSYYKRNIVFCDIEHLGLWFMVECQVKRVFIIQIQHLNEKI
jgi:hypothetical protein